MEADRLLPNRNIYGAGAAPLVPVALGLSPFICCRTSWEGQIQATRSMEELPAPGCRFHGCRAIVLPLNAFPKGSHWGWHILGCSGEGIHPHSHCRTTSISITLKDGVWEFFLLQFFSPPFSLFLSFWPIFVFCRGSGVFLKQLFRRRLLSDGRSVGKSSLPPAIAPPTRPVLLLLLQAAAAFWSMQRNTAPGERERSKNSPLQPAVAPLLPEELWPSGLDRTGPPACIGSLSPHDPVWRCCLP